MKPLRWLYLPNEATEGDQVGPRKAFRLMHEQGLLAAYQACSYLVAAERLQRPDLVQQDLLAQVRAFEPDVVFLQHPSDRWGVDAAFLPQLKAVPSAPRLVVHEGDVYGRLLKPFDRTLRAALAAADLAVVVGLGDLAARVRQAGAPRVLLAPHSYDDERFDTPWQPPPTRPLDAVMIANLACLKRIPGLYLPGGHRRKRLARLFHRAYGGRFVVHGAGQGWRDEPYLRGPIAFGDQERAVRQAWLSINWTLFDEVPMYFSDRLPISLASGVAHITNHQPGIEQVLPGAEGLFLVQSPDEALDVADALLSLPREQLIDIGLRGRDYARQRLHATRVYRDLVVAIGEHLFGDA